MNKKIFYLAILLPLFLLLPLFQGSAIIAPEDLSNSHVIAKDNNGNENSLSTNSVYTYNGTTIEIINSTSDTTSVILNDTYLIDIKTTDGNLTANFYIQNETGMQPQANELLWTIDFDTSENDMTFTFNYMDDTYQIINYGDPNIWHMYAGGYWIHWINGPENGFVDITNDTHLIHVDGYNVDIFDLVNPLNNYFVHRVGPRAWDITYFNFWPCFVLYDPIINLLDIWNDTTNLYPAAPLPPPTIFMGIPFTIAFLVDGVHIEFGNVSIHILQNVVLITYLFIAITFYLISGFIERVVILIFNLTIILYYIIVTELILVIIYESYEIKIYEYQIVIVYEIIEIVILFISLQIWQITIIFHFEFWYIEIIFIMNVFVNIVLPIRWIFIPVFVPVFIPLIYYIPVYITNYVNIYLPYAAPEIFIEVYFEDLKTPYHAIQFYVHDQCDNAIDDATVSIAYNGEDYSTDFNGNGIYEVELPATNETEIITVTATKEWYPTGSLSYDLNVSWIIGTKTTTVTQGSPLPLTWIILSLSVLAIGTTFITKRRKC